MILYIAEDVELPNLQTLTLNRWIKKTAAQYGKKIGKINYIFCSDNRILEVNKQFLNHDYITDIITFDNSKELIIAGEIFISINTIEINSKKFKVSFEVELQRIIIHGVLHLCGQDDKTPQQKLEMIRKENIALKSYLE
jgi:probable rRNA maturation factor